MTEDHPPDVPPEKREATSFEITGRLGPAPESNPPDGFAPTDSPTTVPFLRLEVERLPTGRMIASLAGIVASGAILGLIPELNIAVKGVLLGLMALSALRTWRRWRFPSILELSDGRFRWRLSGRWASTAGANIAAMDLRAGLLRLKFVDAAAVDGVVPTEGMLKGAERTGFHLAIPAGSTTLSQVRQIQATLGIPLQDRDERGESLAAFVSRIRRATPSLWVTPLLIAINVGVFLLMLRTDGSAVRPGPSIFSNGFQPEMMVDWGANFGPRTLAGEPWRLLTCAFLHFNIIHIALNMLMVWLLGRTIERLLGNTAYLTTYLFAAFGGSLASLWAHEDAVGVGASGAVFGLMGAMLGIVLRHRNVFPAEILHNLRSQSVSLLIMNLILGSQIKGVDLDAHIGGAVAGLLCGLAIDSKVSANGDRRSPWQLVRFVAGCVGIGVLVVATLPQPRAAVANVLMDVIRLEGGLVQQLTEAEKKFLAGEASGETYESVVRDEVLPRWDAERVRLEGLERVASVDKPALDDLARFMRLRGESWKLLTQGTIDGDLAEQGRGLLKLDEALAALNLLSDRDGERLGMKLTIPEVSIVPEGAIARLAAVEGDVSRELNQLFDRHDRKELSDRQFAEAIENDLVPPLEKEVTRARGVALEARGSIKSALLRSIRNADAAQEALRELTGRLKQGDAPTPDEAIERLRRLGARTEEGTAASPRSGPAASPDAGSHSSLTDHRPERRSRSGVRSSPSRRSPFVSLESRRARTTYRPDSESRRT